MPIRWGYEFFSGMTQCIPYVLFSLLIDVQIKDITTFFEDLTKLFCKLNCMGRPRIFQGVVAGYLALPNQQRMPLKCFILRILKRSNQNSRLQQNNVLGDLVRHKNEA